MNGVGMASAVDPDEWKRSLTTIAVLYRIAECGDRIHIAMIEDDLQLIEPSIEQLQVKGIIAMEGDYYVVTQRGRELLQKVVEKTFAISQFEIFGAVDLTRQLLPEEMHPEEGGQVLAHVHDPRFADTAQSEDLRLAMFTWLGLHMGDKLPGKIDPREVVFVQKLGQGKFKSDRFWTDLRLGFFFTEIEKIVDAAYKWTDIGENEADCMGIMQGLYACGMLEVQRRSGPTCSGCKAPLALVPENAGECPACGKAFGPSAAEQAAAQATSQTFGCPKCDADVSRTDRFCRGCGATVDFSGAPGEIVTETVEETTTTTVGGFRDTYGYSTVGMAYYDPYDPFVDALAFACLATCLYDPYYW
jgi:hypothetical protein